VGNVAPCNRHTVLVSVFMAIRILHDRGAGGEIPGTTVQKFTKVRPAVTFALFESARRMHFAPSAASQNTAVDLVGGRLAGNKGSTGPPQEGTADADTERLRAGLKALVKRSGRSLREIEREHGLGHGTLGNALRGRSDLCVRHLTVLACSLGLTLGDLLTEAYVLATPEAGRPEPHSRLRALIAEVVRAELAVFWERHGIRLES
jgi:lambda repressor-like predicted transcriptional regulator